MKNIVITTNHPAPYFDRLIDFLQETYIVKALYHFKRSEDKPFLNSDINEQKFYSDLSLVKKFILFRKQDLIIIGGWTILENIFLAFTLYLFSKTKVVYMLDHPDPQYTKDKGLYKLFKKVIFHFSNGLFNASISCKAYMKKVYNINNRKLYIFPYAYDSNINGIENINFQRNESIKRGEKISVLIANRFIKRKGYDVVYKVINKLNNSNLLNELSITIIGTGYEFEKYKSLFSAFNNINMPGWVNNETYESLINNCDIFLHPSHFEPFGIPPVDALARGKYLIVTNKIMSVDFLSGKGHEGISYYNSHNHKQLYDIFKFLLNRKDLIYKNSKNNIRIANEYFNYNLYKTVINNVLSV